MRSKLLTMFGGGGGGIPLIANYGGTVFFDDFSDGPIAAGSVHGTTVPNGGAKRYVVDTTSKLSISTKLLIAAAGLNGNPGIWYTEEDDSGFEFGAYWGVYFAWRASAKGLGNMGLDSNFIGGGNDPRFAPGAANVAGETTTNGDATIISNYSINTTYHSMLFQRGAGSKFMFLEHNDEQVWDIKHTCDDNETAASVFPVLTGNVTALALEAVAVSVIDMSADFSSDPFTGAETEVTLPFTLS